MEELKQYCSLNSVAEKKESELSSSLPSSFDASVLQSRIDQAVLEIIDKEFRNLGLEDNEDQNQCLIQIENEDRKLETVVSENQEGETLVVSENTEIGEEKNETGEVEAVVVNRNQKRDSVEENGTVDGEGNEIQGGLTVDENGSRDEWLEVKENLDGWTVDEANQIREGWTVEENGTAEVKEQIKKSLYPLRPDEPDCVFYLKTGACGFGSNCKFNHPPKNKNKVKSSATGSDDSAQVVEDKMETLRRVGKVECKYYSSPGGCKFGKACRYNHPQERTPPEPPTGFNFLGLPIRPRGRECPFYMRTGSCKYGTNCRFHHPDPIVGGMDSGYDRNSSISIPSNSQPVGNSWSAPSPSIDTVPYSDTSRSYTSGMLQPQGAHPGLEWNGYQEGMVRPSMASSSNGYGKTANGYSHQPQQIPVDGYPERPGRGYSHQQQQMPVDGYPERPGRGYSHQPQQMPVDVYPERLGQKECQYYMNTGECRYKSACRFHHPKNRFPKSPSLSPSGLPLRPGQPLCTHFSRYGICKYGAACKYDHTPNENSSIMTVSPITYYRNHSAQLGGGAANMGEYGDGSTSIVQQLE